MNLVPLQMNLVPLQSEVVEASPSHSVYFFCILASFTGTPRKAYPSIQSTELKLSLSVLVDVSLQTEAQAYLWFRMDLLVNGSDLNTSNIC